MIDSRTISNLLDLKEIWPRLTDNFTPIEERVDPVMPLLVEVFKGVSFTIWISNERITYKLLDEDSTIITNETKKFSTRVSNHVFFSRMLWEEVVSGKNSSYKRGDKLEKIIKQMNS